MPCFVPLYYLLFSAIGTVQFAFITGGDYYFSEFVGLRTVSSQDYFRRRLLAIAYLRPSSILCLLFKTNGVGFAKNSYWRLGIFRGKGFPEAIPKLPNDILWVKHSRESPLILSGAWYDIVMVL